MLSTRRPESSRLVFEPFPGQGLLGRRLNPERGRAPMRLTSFWLAFIYAASLVVAGQDDSNVQSKIIALEKAWNQAYKAGDRKALDGILDDQDTEGFAHYKRFC